MSSSSSERTYYSVRYRLDNRDRYLLWFSAEDESGDGVTVGNDGTIPIFASETELLKSAENFGFTPEEASSSGLHNFDIVAKWLKLKKRLRAQQVDCTEFLDAWNLLSDISHSVGGDFDPDKERTQKIYLKLFWGNNLPSLTPTGKRFVPHWSGFEMKILHEVFSQGLKMLRAHTKLRITR